MTPTPEQIAEYRKDFESTLPTSLVSRGEDGNYSNIYVEFECRGYILARTKQSTEIAELKRKLAMASSAIQEAYSFQSSGVVPSIHDYGRWRRIEATITKLLKD